MMEEAVEAELQFAEDLIGEGMPGMTVKDMKSYLEYAADQRLVRLGMPKQWGSENPFPFMALQDVQELTNFFERRADRLPSGRGRQGRPRRGVLI